MQRAWTQIANQPSSQGLTVVSYNILANKYARSGYHAYCPDKYLDWSYRFPRIQSELLSHQPDIICLQEVEEPTFVQEFVPALRREGYQGLPVAQQARDVIQGPPDGCALCFYGLHYSRHSKPGDAIQGPPDGCALFFKSARLQLLASSLCRFGNHVAPSKAGPFWDQVRAREDGAVLALLRDTQSKRVFCAASLHLFWDPHFPDVKAAQAAIVCAQIQDLLNRSRQSGAPVIMAGDYNSLWRKYRSDPFDKVPEGKFLTSGVYQLLATGQLEVSHQDHPSQRRPDEDDELAREIFSTSGLSLHSMILATPTQREPPLTTKTDKFAGCLDYIFLSQIHWLVTGVLGMPYNGADGSVVDPADVDFPPVPDAIFPSDHLSMGCKLQLLPLRD
ncbi:hypothetical protein WJX72_003259 [[Myrmecia] bisecta]|uniref:Endonuclease/exonuclease/phosphatase domain-containing protein n=1 Tax=[Myrmecia] bisecta TaxID=41462 RepID=A0AAW1PKK0_9CHLO